MTEKEIFQYLKGKGFSEYGVAGLMGNLQAESAMRSNNLEDTYSRKLGMTDEEYTKSVDNGTYKNFANDRAGYGVAQWTYHSRKQTLLEFVKSNGKSIGDMKTQLDFLAIELKTDFASVYKTLTTAKSVKTASDAVLLKFERPADTSESAQAYRAKLGQAIYDRCKGTAVEETKVKETKVKTDAINLPQLSRGSKGETVKAAQTLLISKGFSCGYLGADGDYGGATTSAVVTYQKSKKLDADGIIGKNTWSALLGL